MGGSGGGILGSLVSLIPGIGPFLSTGLGIANTITNANQSAEANNLTNQGIAAQQPIVNAENALYNEASTYDPTRVAAGAAQTALSQGSKTIEQALRNAAGSFTAGGGSPTGDTAFNVGANNIASGIASPILSQEQAGFNAAPQEQMNALRSVFAAPSGQLGQTYFQAAGAKAPAAGSWQTALGQLQQGLFGQAAPSGLSSPTYAPIGGAGVGTVGGDSLPGSSYNANGTYSYTGDGG